MSPRSGTTDVSPFQKIIADAMLSVITELQLADPLGLIVMIGNGEVANIADLVDSSTELYFQRGTLRYALNADCCLRWHDAPVVRFDMEFRHGRVCAFFRLIVGRSHADVEIQDVLFDEQWLDEGERRSRLQCALRAARL